MTRGYRRSGYRRPQPRPTPGQPRRRPGGSARPLLDPEDRLRLGPVPLELVVVALGRREEVDDDRPEVEQDPVRGRGPLTTDRPDALPPSPSTMPSAMASSWRSDPPEQITK